LEQLLGEMEEAAYSLALREVAGWPEIWGQLDLLLSALCPSLPFPQKNMLLRNYFQTEAADPDREVVIKQLAAGGTSEDTQYSLTCLKQPT
jgi:hypothetical protein